MNSPASKGFGLSSAAHKVIKYLSAGWLNEVVYIKHIESVFKCWLFLITVAIMEEAGLYLIEDRALICL